jgi:hypothetical protein
MPATGDAIVVSVRSLERRNLRIDRRHAGTRRRDFLAARRLQAIQTDRAAATRSSVARNRASRQLATRFRIVALLGPSRRDWRAVARIGLVHAPRRGRPRWRGGRRRPPPPALPPGGCPRPRAGEQQVELGHGLRAPARARVSAKSMSVVAIVAITAPDSTRAPSVTATVATRPATFVATRTSVASTYPVARGDSAADWPRQPAPTTAATIAPTTRTTRLIGNLSSACPPPATDSAPTALQACT